MIRRLAALALLLLASPLAAQSTPPAPPPPAALPANVTPLQNIATARGFTSIFDPVSRTWKQSGMVTPLGYKGAIYSSTFGQGDTATGRSVVVNTDVQDAQVMGVPGVEFASFYTDRDSVADFVSNTLPAVLMTLAGSSYTATSLIPATPLTAAQMAELQVGMYIDTLYDSLGTVTQKYTGKITGWAKDGSSITVSGWTTFGNASAGQVPPTGGPNDTAVVNPVTKIWGNNTTCTINPNSYGRKCALVEYDMYNNVVDSDPADPVNTPTAWGVDMFSVTKRGGIGFNLRGPWHTGFYCEAGSAQYACARTDGTPTFGFASFQTAGTPFTYNVGGYDTRWQVNPDGSMEVGDQGASNTAQTTYIDLHSSGQTLAQAADYDARIIAQGGTTTAGMAKVTILASSVQVPTTLGAGGVNTNALNIAPVTPASSSAACVTGDFRADANYVYVCVGTNSWKRAALSSF